jgi:penicillin-binding protein 1C
MIAKLKSYIIKNKSIIIPLALSVLLIAFIAYLKCLPADLFDTPCTTVLYSSDGKLLNARTSSDEQWKFPHNEKVPDKFAKSIVMFEDRYFYYHSGTNPISLLRALWQNIKNRKVVSGGSTISMQVIRLHRQGKPRTIKEKIIEIILSSRLELRYSKKEILALYASNAPFGGNVIGLDAACWRYYDNPPENLSWGQAATLAVLPNSPSLVHPGRNREVLYDKRNRLLDKLCNAGYLDSLELQLAKAEPLPGKPHPLPQHAPHLFERIRAEGFNGQNIHTTLDYNVQTRVNQIASIHNKKLRNNRIDNLAILVCETHSGNVLAYIGNIYNPTQPINGMHVDVINSLRSPGSILKPFLYAGMLSDGYILPNTLVPDIPTNFKGFSPENFNKTFDGAVPASRALSRSLNIPAIKMLQDYSAERFLDLLKDIGFTKFSQSANHYGLSIILGGAEVSLWETTGAFASLGRILLDYNPEAKYTKAVFKPLNYYYNNKNVKEGSYSDSYHIPISPGAAFHTINALKEVHRPEEEFFWRDFSSTFPVAWKTGTSYGFRDAWAIGITPEYTVGIWVGNASGEGRPDLTGINAAAPILFDVFKVLRPSRWFTPPYDDMEEVGICKASGHRANTSCTEIDTLWIPRKGLTTLPCPYHKIIHLDVTEKFRVNSSCEKVNNIISKSWFVLPPVQEFYYKQKNPFYKQLPPIRQDCGGANQQQRNMEIIYPPNNAKLFIPIEIDGKEGETVFKLAHRNENAEVFWHLDNEFLTTTSIFHEISVRPSAGHHILTIVDETGETITRRFEVLRR